MIPRSILGRTGFNVSKLGFGCWASGSYHYGKVSKTNAIKSLTKYLDAGGNFIDTARAYGQSESLIGNILRNNERKKIILCSKTLEVEKKKIEKDLEKSLKLLKTDYLDIYYLHSPPNSKYEMEKILSLFEKFKKDGKIRAIGASIKGCDVTQKTVDLSNQYIKSNKIDVLQVIYSIFRQKNSEVFKIAKDNKVGIVARTILENGFLTGKYFPGHVFKGNDHRKRWNQNNLFYILEQTKRIKETYLKPPLKSVSEIAMKFIHNNNYVAVSIIGSKSAIQTQENIDSFNHSYKNKLINKKKLFNLYKSKFKLFNRY